MQVSEYAASSKKELVAEVFTGMAYGFMDKPVIMQLYVQYGGPVPPPPVGGGRRRRWGGGWCGPVSSRPWTMPHEGVLTPRL